MIPITPNLGDDYYDKDILMMMMKMMMGIMMIATLLSILIPDPEMEVLPFYASIAQASSGLSVTIAIMD